MSMNMRKASLQICITLAAVLTSTASLAQDAPPAATPAPEEESKGGFLADAKVGGVLSFGGTKPNVRPAIGLGWVFPWMKRAIAAELQVDYAALKQEGSESDPRVNNGKYDWHLTQQTLVMFPWVMYRITSLGRVTPYAGIGPRFYFLRQNVKGSSGATIEETQEPGAKYGVGVPLGVEFALGPGALLGELLLEYGPLDHKATGDTNTGGLTLFLGYRFLLLAIPRDGREPPGNRRLFFLDVSRPPPPCPRPRACDC
jgi:hypothetical protein